LVVLHLFLDQNHDLLSDKKNTPVLHPGVTRLRRLLLPLPLALAAAAGPATEGRLGVVGAEDGHLNC
jgi:hypothetical protein